MTENTMNEKYVNALLTSVSRQRDQALNAIVQLEAQVVMLQNEVNDLKKSNGTTDEAPTLDTTIDE